MAILNARINSPPMGNILRLKFILLFVCALCSSLVNAAVVVEPEISDSPWSRLLPTWKIDDVTIAVVAQCTINNVGYPSKRCAPPYVSIRTNNPENAGVLFAAFEASMSVDGITINSYTAGGTWPLAENIKIFELLRQKSKAKATIRVTKPNRVDSTNVIPINSETVETIVLSKFSEASAAYISEANRTYEEQLRGAQISFIMNMLFLLGLFIVAVLVIWKVVKSITSKSKAVIEKAGAELEERRVRRIAEDEAIRATVRKSVETAEEQEITAIKDRIKAALDAGDTETASLLLGLLQKRSTQ